MRRARETYARTAQHAATQLGQATADARRAGVKVNGTTVLQPDFVDGDVLFGADADGAVTAEVGFSRAFLFMGA